MLTVAKKRIILIKILLIIRLDQIFEGVQQRGRIKIKMCFLCKEKGML